MRKRAWLMVVMMAVLATSAVGAAEKLESCPGGSCRTSNCDACCPAEKSPSCSWWRCKCTRDAISAVEAGPGSILDR